MKCDRDCDSGHILLTLFHLNFGFVVNIFTKFLVGNWHAGGLRERVVKSLIMTLD
jgi:hypothetical protein